MTVKKSSVAEILIEALPYIQALDRKTVVIKFGGNAMVDEDLKSSFAQDIVLLKQVGREPGDCARRWPANWQAARADWQRKSIHRRYEGDR